MQAPVFSCRLGSALARSAAPLRLSLAGAPKVCPVSTPGAFDGSQLAKQWHNQAIVILETTMPEALTPRRYSTPVIAIHWLTVLLVIAVYCLMEFKGIYAKGSPEREAMKAWHFTLGMTVFALTWLRLLFRARSKTPPITPPIPQWQRTLSMLTHGLLLAMLIMLPITGWMMVNAFGNAVPFWGMELPQLAMPDREAGLRLKDLHETVASFGYLLIGLHAVAGLYHHYVMKDDTLQRMRPH